MENLTHNFRETNLVLQLISESQAKSKNCDECERKKKAFFKPFVLSEGNLFNILFFLNV